MSGYYPATYGFENDKVGDVPNDWDDNSEGTNSIRIESQKMGHNNVLHLADTGSGKVRGRSFFPNQTHGTFELWVLAEDCDRGLEIHLNNNDTNVLFRTILIEDNKWKSSDETTASIIPAFDGVCDPVDNTWYHIIFHFRGNSAPSYQGLGLNKYRVIIDNTYDSGELDAANALDYVSRLAFKTRAVEGVDSWVDAVGFSWDLNYNIGNNLEEGLLLSFENSTNLDWQGYSLDGQANKTIIGNSTIPLPSDGSHSIQVFGNNSIGEIFESDMRYFTVKSINLITPENKTYTEPMSGYYPATYGFENDEIDAIPRDWTDESYGPTWFKVIANEDGHNNVLQLYDTTGGDPYAIKAIGNKESGTVEFWMKNVNMNEKAYFAPRIGTTQLFRVLLADNKVIVLTQGSTAYDLAAAAADTWHHFSVDFECGTGGYKGLGQDEFYVTYSGTRYGPYNFWNGASSAENIAFSGFYGSGNYYYVDAVGYSWDPNYNIGDNLNEGLLLSYTNNSALDWVGFSLDRQANKTIIGNKTIPFPSGGLHTIQVFGNSSLGYYYESDIRYFTVEVEDITIDLLTPESITYTDPMSGYYPATFGFENDKVGDVPNDWEDNSEGTNSIKVVSHKLGHYNVLQLDDTGSGKVRGITYFADQSYGTIELWVLAVDCDRGLGIHLLNNDTDVLFRTIIIEDNKWKSSDETTATIIPAFNGVYDPIDNTWYHVMIHFRGNSAPSYQGLGLNKLQINIDGIYDSGELDAANALDFVNKIALKSRAVEGVDSWVDAVGFSWDPNYNIGDNLKEGLLLSYTNSSTLEWMGYSLDNQANITITGNTVIPMPENGLHSIQVYGRSTLGYYYASNLVNFTVDISEPPPPPPGDDDFILIFILIGVFSMVGLTIAIVVYKRFHTSSIKPKPVKEPKPRKKPKKKKGSIIMEEIFCPFCGTSITPQHKFCTYCGSDLRERLNK
jgi:hypothetical protein